MKTARVSIVFLIVVCFALAVVACGGGGEEEPTPTPTATPPPATATAEATPTPTPTATPTAYEVQPGDTLANIADQFGVDVEALAAANDISDPNLIYVGQTLTIPPPAP